MLDYVIITKHEGSVYTMTICIIALAAYWLTRSDVSTVCDIWSEILTGNQQLVLDNNTSPPCHCME